ncbi:TetR/AcrR family transcriptional regulator [Paenibacillus taichungensis]|uniref:TetR/AcrR family transcriptional regulator n=1 Tax=Paenibacillus taichungensis TaxID=484184 RepID=UPI0039A6A036
MYHINRDKRSIQSSEWIFEALLALTDEMDYEKISVTDIVNRAKVGRSTFYRNFDQKDDVFKFKCNQTCLRLREYLTDYQTQYDVPPGPASSKPFFTFWSSNTLLIEALIKINRIDILSDSYVEVLRQYYDDYTYLLDGIPSDYVEYVMAANVGSSIGVLVQWIKNNKRESPEDIAEIVMHQLLSNYNRLI